MVTFVGLQSSSFVQWGSVMSAADWRSEESYANFGVAEGADIAWEWLRRDTEYERDFRKLTAAAQLNGAPRSFRRKWGLSFRSRS
jgi:Family of unknown function (DUF6499)